MPGVAELLDAIEVRAFANTDTALSRRVAWRAIVAMAQAARRSDTPPEAAALLGHRVQRIAERLARVRVGGDEGAWAAELARQLRDPQALEMLIAERPRAPSIPPGDPIGTTDWMGPAER
jgi:hypothetical protein